MYLYAVGIVIGIKRNHFIVIRHVLSLEDYRHCLQDLQSPYRSDSHKKSIKLLPSDSCITAINSDFVLSQTTKTKH